MTQAAAISRFRRYQQAPFFRLLISSFMMATAVMPMGLLRFLSLPFIILFILFNRKNFNAIELNMSRIYKNRISRFKRMTLAYRVFRNYSYYLIEFFYLSHNENRFGKFNLEIQNREYLTMARERGKGIIFLTIHMGNWEIGGLYFTSLGFPLHVAYAPDEADILERNRSICRNGWGIKEIPLLRDRFSSIRVLRLLQDNGIVAMQGDRLQFDKGVSLPFFGHQATFPKGPFQLAISSGSTILPVFIVRGDGTNYRIILERPVFTSDNHRKEDSLEKVISEVLPVFENYIRKFPDQWYTFMPFWDEDKIKLRI
ncbi:MAG: lysophospholipid acyltransferase family protein [Nitrospirota bacterium]